MAAQYGRTIDRWTTLSIDDAGGVMRQIAVTKIGGEGLDFPVVDLTATQDPAHGGLPDTPNFKMTIAGPIDTTALTGSHIVLTGVAGGGTPLSLNIQHGMQHAYVAGEPTFGITSTATAGVLVTKYDADFSTGMYSADIILFPGSAAPAWGVAAYT